MASKGDSSYKPYFDDLWYYTDESEDDTPIERSRTYNQWFDEHYEVLMELYRNFKSSGESVFGYAFFQLGNFPQFASFIYENTQIMDADLLKAKIAQTHVNALGLSARSERRLPALQKSDAHGQPGTSDAGIRRWSEAVGAATTDGC